MPYVEMFSLFLLRFPLLVVGSCSSSGRPDIHSLCASRAIVFLFSLLLGWIAGWSRGLLDYMRVYLV